MGQAVSDGQGRGREARRAGAARSGGRASLRRIAVGSALLAALELAAPAGATVRVVVASGSGSASGGATPLVGGLDCDHSTESGPVTFGAAESCLQNFGRRCRVYDAYGWTVFSAPAGTELEGSFGVTSEALGRGLPETCDDVTGVTASGSADFSAEISVDRPTEVQISARTRNGGSVSVSLPGVTIPPDQNYAKTLTVQPPGFTVTGSVAASQAGLGEDFEQVSIGFSFAEPPRPPVVVIPGIAGTYALDPGNDAGWLFERGIAPDQTRVDPLSGAYDDLLQTLRNVGYVDGRDLWVVNYDWRLPPAPSDGSFDGVIAGLTAASISDTSFAYGVDYLGHVLREVAAQWESDHGQPLSEVDVIAHSTGGLLARAYLQSAAYAAPADPTLTLPEVRKLILVGVPNRGASKAWNPIHDNWVSDPAYVVLLSKILNRVYLKLPNGALVSGPQTISLASILDPATGQRDPQRMIAQYLPSVRSLLATYDFLDRGNGFENVNTDPALRNDLLLDLNAGFDLQPALDPVPFANLCETTVIYGTNVATPTSVIERFGPRGSGRPIAAFTDFVPRAPLAGERWFEDRIAPASGDGTVPIDSSAGLFFGDPRVALAPFATGLNTAEPVSHVALLFNPDVQQRILSTLDVSFQPSDVSTSLHRSTAGSLWSGRSVVGLGALVALLDPVDGFARDGAGRRLGYTGATGPLTEVPDSVWVGGGDGFGFALGPVSEPVELVLTGLGEAHYAGAGVLSKPAFGGAVAAGLLGTGEEDVTPVALAPLGPDCDNGVDDDADGLADLDDPGCTEAADASEQADASGCDDGVDDDGDGLVDTADPGCADAADDDEHEPTLACDNGLDDDGDGRADYPADPGCSDPGWAREDPACQDGRDDDGDAGIDFDGGASLDLDGDGFVDAAFDPATPAVGAVDPECEGRPSRRSETSGCGLGAELAWLLPGIAAWRRRRTTLRERRAAR